MRDSYAVGEDKLLLVTSDRLSAFDVVMNQPIPDKGRVLNEMIARTTEEWIVFLNADAIPLNDAWLERLLRPLLDAFPQVPRLALTATADAHTRADILDQLGIPADGLVLAGFDRPNIR